MTIRRVAETIMAHRVAKLPRRTTEDLGAYPLRSPRRRVAKCSEPVSVPGVLVLESI